MSVIVHDSHQRVRQEFGDSRILKKKKKELSVPSIMDFFTLLAIYLKLLCSISFAKYRRLKCCISILFLKYQS